MAIKKGSSFSIYGTAFRPDGGVLDLTGYTLESTLVNGEIALPFSTVVLDAVNGEFRLDMQLGVMPSGWARFDVKFTNGPIEDHSQTEQFEITKAVTQ